MLNAQMVQISKGIVVVSLATSMTAAALPTGFTAQTLKRGMNMVSSALLPDGRVLMVEKFGVIQVFDQKSKTAKVALDIKSKVYSNFEAGMTQVAVDPGFASNGYLYVEFTKIDAVGVEDHDWLARFKMTGDVIDPASETKLLDLGAKGPNYHHGGGLAIKDGHLYIAVGSRRCCMGFRAGADDGNTGGSNQYGWAADTKRVEGKILRIKIPSGEIPVDNPFYSQNTGDARAVWAYNLRNPFSLSFHPSTGKLYGTDVKDGSGDDEVNEYTAGKEYGGGDNSSGNLWKASNIGGCAGGAMIGSQWYTGTNFPAEYRNKYWHGQVRSCASNLIYGDASTNLKKFGPINGGNSTYSPIDVKMGADGALYVSTRYQTENAHATDGAVVKIWYGTEPAWPGVVSLSEEARNIASTRLDWSVQTSTLVIHVREDGNQTLSLNTLDGKTLTERTVSGRCLVSLPISAKGLHVLTWTNGSLKGAVKVML